MPDEPVEAVRVFVLSCGQANTNWIEYYADKTSKVPTATAIFDLGKSNRPDDGDDQALKWILKRIAGFYDLKKETTHKIEFVAFSHADEDHWGMSKALWKAKPDNLTIKIKKVYRGGMEWGAQGIADVKQLANDMAAGARKTPVIIESYRSDLKDSKAHLHKFSDKCRCRVVIANSKAVNLANKPQRPNPANATSLVLAVEMAGKTVLLTGDATWVTMHGINALYQEGVGPADCYAMTLPHHGAMNTSKNPKVAEKKDDKWILNEFAQHVKPKRIVASAGYKNSYRHPSREVMTLFETGLTTPSTKHGNIVFNGTKSTNYELQIHSWTSLGDNKNNVTPDSTNTDAGVEYTVLDKEEAKVTVNLAGAARTGDQDPLLGGDGTKKKKAPPSDRKRKREDAPPEKWKDGNPLNDDPEERRPKKKRRVKRKRTPLPTNLRHNNIEYLLTSAGKATTRIFAAGVTDDSGLILEGEG